MKVRVTERAFADRRMIFDHLNQHSQTGAINVIERLDQVVRRIGQQPLGGKATDIDDVRVVFAGRYPYRVFYRIHDKSVQILHIRHTALPPTDQVD